MANRNAVRIEGDDLIVTPRGLDRLWGFHGKIVVPLASISEVGIEQHPHQVPRGLRYPGTDVYWKKCGTFHPDGERHYWNYAGSREALSIRLDGSGDFDQLYLSVSDADGLRHLVAQAVAAHEERGAAGAI